MGPITSGASGTGNGTVAYSVAANPNTTARTATISAGRADVQRDAGRGSLQHDHLADREFADRSRRGSDGGGDGECGVVCVDGREQCGVDHDHGRRQRHRERQRVVQRGRQCADERAHRHDDDCRTDDDGDAGGRAVQLRDLADGGLAGAGGLDEHGDRQRLGGLRVDGERKRQLDYDYGGASGSGNGTVTYSVTANPTITARNATMTIAGQSFDVTQAGQTCTYTLTPAGASVPATTTTGTVDVAALGGCAWTATSSAAWVTITSGATGSGNGTLATRWPPIRPRVRGRRH